MNILFVCSGNISRSFLAEMLLKNEIARLKTDDISIASAGLFAYPGNPPDPDMVDFLTRMEITVKKHAAKQIAKQDVDWADLIIVMEKDHAAGINKMWPEVKGKVELLGSLILEGQNPDDIIDPFGKSTYHYRLVQAQISLAIKNLVKRLGLSKRNNTGSKFQVHGSMVLF